MYVIEPRNHFNDENKQMLVKKTYELQEIGWVMVEEEIIWSEEHKTSEEWFEVPEQQEE
jgi:hypothetical protein